MALLCLLRVSHGGARAYRSVAAAGLLVAGFAGLLPAQGTDVPSDVTFNLRRRWLTQLLTGGPEGHSVGARWTDSLVLVQHSKVHTLANDCELHFGAKLTHNRIVAEPRAVIVEPPNVCRRLVAGVPTHGTSGQSWLTYFDAHETGRTCEVTGYPRIFSEHAAGGGSDGSNPDHVIEMHPMLGVRCDGATLDLVPNLRVYAGMHHITDPSAIACLGERRLYVRARGSGDDTRYEFLEEGAKGSGGRCGNFVAVDAHIGKEYLRTLTNGGDHVALAQVWVGEAGPFPLKLYTYAGTPEDRKIADLLANPDDYATVQLRVLGLLTYDYFTIAQALQDESFAWLPAAKLASYVEIESPLALVVFGKVAP